jgi:hypothetical protein
MFRFKDTEYLSLSVMHIKDVCIQGFTLAYGEKLDMAACPSMEEVMSWRYKHTVVKPLARIYHFEFFQSIFTSPDVKKKPNLTNFLAIL